MKINKNYGKMRETNPHKRDRLLYRNKLAKDANKRMRELEKTGLDYGAGNRKYRKFIKETYGKNTRKRRFREYGEYDNYVTKEIHRLEKFLGYQTSTVEGVQLQKSRQKENTEKRYGVKFETMEEYEQFVDFLTENEGAKMLGSGQVIDLYKKGVYSQEEIDELFSDFRNKSPESTDEIANKLGFETTGDMVMWLEGK